MNRTQKDVLKLEKEIEHLKFSYEINKSFLIPIFNANITRQLAFFGGAIAVLQIEAVQKSWTAISYVAVIAALLILFSNLNYYNSTKRLQENMTKIGAEIDKKYAALHELLK